MCMLGEVCVALDTMAAMEERSVHDT
eukprot:CCRYP_003965-RA/>CCRYP_003965-RA protein AED:0.28 eAED:0.28 QI:0/-1/0/1/-1/0/1/0/25